MLMFGIVKFEERKENLRSMLKNNFKDNERIPSKKKIEPFTVHTS